MADESRIRSYKNKGKNTEVKHWFLIRFFQLQLIFNVVTNCVQDMRLKRITQAIELRKAKKDDQLLKRRNISDDEKIQATGESVALITGMTPEEIVQGNNCC